MQSSSSFIDDLSPLEKRYDLEIDPNLFISVLPNGVKTWVLCDMVLGKPRRKTLGVYPQMSLSDARDVVEKTSSIGRDPEPQAAQDDPLPVRKPASPPPLTIRDGRIVPAGGSRWPLIAAAAAGLAVIVGAAYFWMQSGSEAVVPGAFEPTSPPVSAPLTAKPANLEPHSEKPFAPPGDEALAAEAASPDDQASRVAPVIDPSVAEPAPPTPAAVEPDLPDAAGEPVAMADQSQQAAVGDASAQDTPDPVIPAVQANAAQASDDKPADNTSVVADNTLTAGAVPDIPQARAPTRGVARYQLTSEIRAREPTDDLQQTVNGRGADLRRVYFFTDLRGLTGESVTHRWLYNGELSATVDFDVRGWRWRVYSSKDLLPDQAGDWTVEVIDKAGEMLATHAFSYLP